MNNKGVTITLITILCAILIFLVGGMIYLLNSNFDFSDQKIFSSQSTKLIEEKEIVNIKDLNIKTNIADISVEEKDINNIKVELYSNHDNEEYSITEKDNEIEIIFKTKKKVGFSFLFNKQSNVKVYVPTNYNKNVKINSDVGDVKINNLPDADLTAKLKTGDVKIKQINDATINLNTGDVKADSVKELVTETTTGDIKVEAVNVIEAKTTTGDIKINNVSKVLTLTTNTGDVKIENATIEENSKITTGTGDVNIKSISGCYVEGSTKVGDTNIKNNDRKSDIELKITSRVGDIDVNY